jgi:hypothetical protein
MLRAAGVSVIVLIYCFHSRARGNERCGNCTGRIAPETRIT